MKTNRSLPFLIPLALTQFLFIIILLSIQHHLHGADKQGADKQAAETNQNLTIQKNVENCLL
ncbi:MAG: hypothetical protein MZV65_02000 [Chromatiales bacterium]|nr:hypothetical protein [Chromatiales bacterium]